MKKQQKILNLVNNMNKNWWLSATKIVLILFATSSVALTFLGKIDGVDFKEMVMLVLAFYFGQKINTK